MHTRGGDSPWWLRLRVCSVQESYSKRELWLLDDNKGWSELKEPKVFFKLSFSGREVCSPLPFDRDETILKTTKLLPAALLPGSSGISSDLGSSFVFFSSSCFHSISWQKLVRKTFPFDVCL